MRFYLELRYYILESSTAGMHRDIEELRFPNGGKRNAKLKSRTEILWYSGFVACRGQFEPIFGQ
jgi:hypothetical protein